jgi:hypothetical protein
MLLYIFLRSIMSRERRHSPIFTFETNTSPYGPKVFMHTALCQLHERGMNRADRSASNNVLIALPYGRSQAALLSSYAVVPISIQAQLVRAPLQADFVPLQHMVRVQARKQSTFSQTASSQAPLRHPSTTPQTPTSHTSSNVYLCSIFDLFQLGKAAHCCQQLLIPNRKLLVRLPAILLAVASVTPSPGHGTCLTRYLLPL